MNQGCCVQYGRGRVGGRTPQISKSSPASATVIRAVGEGKTHQQRGGDGVERWRVMKGVHSCMVSGHNLAELQTSPPACRRVNGGTGQATVVGEKSARAGEVVGSAQWAKRERNAGFGKLCLLSRLHTNRSKEGTTQTHSTMDPHTLINRVARSTDPVDVTSGQRLELAANLMSGKSKRKEVGRIRMPCHLSGKLDQHVMKGHIIGWNERCVVQSH